MAFKFEIINNALQITDTVSSEVLIYLPARDAWFNENDLDKQKVVVYGVSGHERESREFDLTDCIDNNDVAFTESSFRTWCSVNLGFSVGGGTSLTTPKNVIYVTQDNFSTTLGSGSINSSLTYFLTEIINVGTTSIEVPQTGLYMRGWNFDISGLTSTEDNFTLFTSPVGGSGNILFDDFHIDISGSNSKVYDIFSDNGFKAIEINRINYNNCTSRGVIDNYRQGLETGTGYFGGTPELELKGTWVGGYFIDTSIVRSLTDGSYSLFKAGAGFTMNSRFRSNQNIDLPASASFLDFTPSNFPNPSTLDLDGCRITRNGVSNPEDTNIIPNILNSDLASNWRQNQGIKNTFVGGKLTVTSETATVISDTSTYYDIAGTFTSSDLEHFDSPSNGQLRHLGDNPREYKVFLDAVLDGGSNNVLYIKLIKWDDSDSSFVDIGEQVRQVNALVGARDVAFFTFSINVELDQNDYIKFQVRNSTNTTNLTLENNSSFIVEER